MEDDEPKIKDDDDIAEELDSSTIEEDDKNIELDISKEVQENGNMNDSINKSFTKYMQSKSRYQQKEKNQSKQVAQLQKKIKAKDKEISKFKKKLQKLQQTYRQKFQFITKMEADKQIFLKFIEISMKHKKKEDFRKMQVGQYCLQQLLKHFQIQDPQSNSHDIKQSSQQKEQKPEAQIQDLKNQIEALKSKNQTLSKKVQIQEQQVANLKAENILKVFRSTVKQDSEQQMDMHKKISFQSTQILKLKEKLSQAKDKITDLECELKIGGHVKKQEVQQIQKQEIKVQLHTTISQEKSQVFYNKDALIQSNKDRQQFQQKIFQLRKRNSYLDTSLKSTVDELNNLKLKLAQLTQLQQTVKRHPIRKVSSPHIDDDALIFDLDDNVPKIKKLQDKIRDLESVIQLQMENQKILSLRVKQFKNFQGPGSTDIIYLKNIILKYMQYLAQKNLKQAEILQYVIFSVLRCDGADLKNLVKLRENSGLFKFFKPRGMAPPNQARAIKYKSQSSFDGSQDSLSQSMIHTSRQQIQRNSLGDLNKSMHGYLNTERAIMKNDQNIFNS